MVNPTSTASAQSGEGAKLWGGRFSCAVDPLMEQFNASIGFDKAMYAQDIRGSIAYAKALAKAELITESERDDLVQGLQQVLAEWESGVFQIHSTDEDIHTANERRLTEIVGAVGGKLHTGRSRNDQVATDLRLWVVDAISGIRSALLELIGVLVHRAEADVDVLMPGYTHMQRAQPIRWSHYLLSHVVAFQNDLERLDQLLARVNLCPLGSGALAGNPLGIDRDFLAKELGFAGVTRNSLEATGGRDFVAELLFWCSLAAMHVSKAAEDLVIYSTKEFGFVSLSDAYSTGSSLMPQKKNADSLELLRGKAGRVFGNHAGFMMTLKALPSTYNKDLQEDKEPLFDSVANIRSMLAITAGVIATLTVNRAAMAAALSPDMLATDLAYYLVRKGVPFRTAHSVAGQVVKAAEDKKCPVSELTLTDLQSISADFTADVQSLWDFEASVEQYSVQGGTARAPVMRQITEAHDWLQRYALPQ